MTGKGECRADYAIKRGEPGCRLLLKVEVKRAKEVLPKKGLTECEKGKARVRWRRSQRKKRGNEVAGRSERRNRILNPE